MSPLSPYVRPVTWVIGSVLIFLGFLGFFANGMLLLFEVDVVHNFVHVLSGVFAIAAASMGEHYARMYLIVFGIVYGLVAGLGFLTDTVVDLFHVNMADNMLHGAIGVTCFYVGLVDEMLRQQQRA